MEEILYVSRMKTQLKVDGSTNYIILVTRSTMEMSILCDVRQSSRHDTVVSKEVNPYLDG